MNFNKIKHFFKTEEGKFTLILLLIFVLSFGGLGLLVYATQLKNKKMEKEEGDAVVVIKGTDDGCDVKRFYDKGRYHYFTECKNGQQNSIVTEEPGKR